MKSLSVTQPSARYNASMSEHFILGTAGHIDHGKTSLIHALTGTDTDRLPEEKKRGITIELGFAELELNGYRLGIVDVPGHEKFVRQMLAGATGMDLALLVVAADDSIKPQTREHLEILKMLNINSGVIALTKSDLVDDDWIELVEEEIRELVADSFLANSPIVRVSAKTGGGIAQLKEVLLAAVHSIKPRTDSSSAAAITPPFRLAIDRTFTMAGHGTIVTGSVTSGRTKVGDELEIQPGDVKVRVRQLQSHDRTVDEVGKGQRAAINLVGIHHDETERGQELASPGFLSPSDLANVELRMLSGLNSPLKDRRRVRLHLGTAEIMCTVRLLEQTELAGGAVGFAQLFLQEPAVMTWNQPFVVRSESPVETIGGGRILHPHPPRIKKRTDADHQMLTGSASDDPISRAAAAVYFAGYSNWSPEELPRTAGVIPTDELIESLSSRGELQKINLTPSQSFFISQHRLRELADRIAAVVGSLHDRFPLRSFFKLEDLRAPFQYLPTPSLLDAAIQELKQQDKLNVTPQGVALVGRGPQLSQNEQKLMVELVELFRTSGLTPPTLAEARDHARKNKDSVPQLIQLAVANGDLVEIAPDLFLHSETENAVRQRLVELLEEKQQVTLADIRDAWKTSRKYAVPLCEFYDRLQVTCRNGDLRSAGSNLTVC